MYVKRKDVQVTAHLKMLLLKTERPSMPLYLRYLLAKQNKKQKSYSSF